MNGSEKLDRIIILDFYNPKKNVLGVLQGVHIVLHLVNPVLNSQ